MYLYDTNIVSELTKVKQDSNLLSFMHSVNKAEITTYISVVSLGEIIQGIEKLKRRNDFPQAQKLQNWYDDKLLTVIDNILPFTEDCAKVWGKLMATNPHNPIDKQLVATAMVHELTLVTRNIKDIQATGVKFINPFQANFS